MYELIKEDLGDDQARTFQLNDQIIQACRRKTSKGHHYTGVITNAWKEKGSTMQFNPKFQLSYSAAVQLFLNDPMLTVIQIFKLPLSIPIENPIEVIKAATSI